MSENNDYETIDGIPRDEFLRHVLPLIIEGDVVWDVADEVRECLSYDEIADPSHVDNVKVNEDRLIVVSTFKATVSERVSRATHWHPAEYKNHDVEVFLEATLPWPDEEDGYALPSETNAIVEQRSYPTEPSHPTYEPYDPMER
jgi:hypothetical protein